MGVTIEQKGSTVTLIVETPEGNKESIERTLREYGQVVLGEKAPDELLDSPQAILELRQELRLAHARIEGLRDISASHLGDIERLHQLLALAIQRDPSPMVHVHTSASASAHSSVHVQQLEHLRNRLSELVNRLPSGSVSFAELDDADRELAILPVDPSPESLAKSGALAKVGKFLRGLGDKESNTSKALGGIERALEIARDLGEAYNAIAGWCGLPRVPAPILGKPSNN